jgi:hypothetical protein
VKNVLNIYGIKKSDLLKKSSGARHRESGRCEVAVNGEGGGGGDNSENGVTVKCDMSMQMHSYRAYLEDAYSVREDATQHEEAAGDL